MKKRYKSSKNNFKKHKKSNYAYSTARSTLFKPKFLKNRSKRKTSSKKKKYTKKKYDTRRLIADSISARSDSVSRNFAMASISDEFDSLRNSKIRQRAIDAEVEIARDKTQTMKELFYDIRCDLSQTPHEFRKEKMNMYSNMFKFLNENNNSNNFIHEASEE